MELGNTRQNELPPKKWFENGEWMLSVDPEVDPEWRPLRHGEYIKVGDIFKRKVKPGPYTIIGQYTRAGSGVLNGLMWMTCYPEVYRHARNEID